VQHLEGHIDHFSSTPESVRARYQLADSYRQQVLHDTLHRNATTASEKLSPDASEHFLELNKTSWTRAAEEFSKLEELVKEPEPASLLSNRQKAEIPFNVAECYFNLGEYEKALQKFEELAQKWGKTPHGLLALGWTVRCLGSMNDFERLQRRTEEVRIRFSETEGLSEGERKQWLDWLSRISKPLQTDPGGNSSNEQPKIINENSDGSRANHQGGPMIESPQR
jgi:tetratricopeptide (TPR) repeat protein